GWVVVLVVWSSSKDLAEERLGDRHATRVDHAGFTEPLERGVSFLVAGVGKALGSSRETDADAATLIACRPADAGLVRHASRVIWRRGICSCPGMGDATAPRLTPSRTSSARDVTASSGH